MCTSFAIVAAVVTCLNQGPATRPSPDDALRTLTTSIKPYAPDVDRGTGPVIVVINRGDEASLGPWKFPYVPARRLDGTLIDAPPFTYGGSFFPNSVGNSGGGSARSSSSSVAIGGARATPAATPLGVPAAGSGAGVVPSGFITNLNNTNAQNARRAADDAARANQLAAAAAAAELEAQRAHELAVAAAGAPRTDVNNSNTNTIFTSSSSNSNPTTNNTNTNNNGRGHGNNGGGRGGRGGRGN